MGSNKNNSWINNLVYTTTEDEVKVFAYSSVLPIKINEFKNHFQLKQNYPNPFNPNPIIRFALPNETRVDLKIYSILGEELVTLISNQVMSAGNHEIEFAASNISSGVYFYRLVTDGFTDVKKMLLVK